jgi:phasin family protein
VSENKSNLDDVDWGFAVFDFAKFIESCQIGGADMTSLIDAGKNIEALIEVNRSAYDRLRDLMARQAEVFQEAMTAVEAGDEATVGLRTEIAGQAFKALGNMRQFAETATGSQEQTFESLRRRFEDGMAAMRNQGGSV